jgi:polar amino acid transport system substrate-binding protein
MDERAIAKDLAPSGTLRAAINLGNPVLAQRDRADGPLTGVSVALAHEFARSLKIPLELVTFETAGQVVAAIAQGAWDVAFLAVDPGRAAGIAFTPPYVIIEGSYMVRTDSPLRAVGDVDRDGTTIAAGKNSAYDLYLMRALKHAKLVHAPSSRAAIDLFLSGKTDVAAGIRKPLVDCAASNPGVRVLDGRFMAIEQAMGTLKNRTAGFGYLVDFIEAKKASGFVAEALARSGQADALVAPCSGPE